MTSTQLAETLFGAYRRRVLAVLLLHPEKSFYVRELSRLANVSAGSLHRELKRLASTGLLIRWSVGNQVHYQVNRDCPGFEELAGFFRKTVGLADVLREALQPLASQVTVAFVYGSVAWGKEQAASDVDVMVIGDVSFPDVVWAMAPMHERLMREINPVVMSRADFRRRFQKNDRFVERIVNEPKIYLTGSDDELAKLVQDRTAQGASG